MDDLWIIQIMAEYTCPLGAEDVLNRTKKHYQKYLKISKLSYNSIRILFAQRTWAMTENLCDVKWCFPAEKNEYTPNTKY